MGILRYFLALVVVSSHIPVVFLKPLDGNGGLAVQAFFVISGFYMSLIVEKYQLSSFRFAQVKNFYLSRALRIFPLYYVCLFITLGLALYNIIPPPPFHLPSEALQSLNSLSDKAIYLFENMFLFGQAAMRFFIYDPHAKAFIFDPLNSPSVPGAIGAGFAILGQAWTLSLELSFYLLVPFLLIRPHRTILILCLLTFILRIVLGYLGYDNYNMQHAFFPTSLGIFLLGVLSHRLLYSRIRDKPKSVALQIGAWTILFCVLFYATIIYHLIDHYSYKYWLFIILVTVALPYLFWVTKQSILDRYIGELSYPIYMTHFFCIALALKWFGLSYIGYTVFFFTNIAAILLVVLVVKPLDQFRHEQFLQDTPKPMPQSSYPVESQANA